MPKRWNTDHSPALVDHTKRAVMPGESWDFTEEQIAAGLAGSWSEEDPRAGLKAEKQFKATRDAGAKGAKALGDLKAAAEGAKVGDGADEQETPTPAESGDTEE